MTGHWTKDRPQETGQYWTASRDGLLAGIQTVAYHEGKCVFAGHALYGDDKGWGGWWWSEPVEEPPTPGEW